MATGWGGYRSQPRKERRERLLSEVVAGRHGADLASLVSRLMDVGPPAAETPPLPIEPVVAPATVSKPRAVRRRVVAAEQPVDPESRGKMLVPLPSEYSESIHLEAARHSDRARGVRIRVIASLYAGLDHAAAARANKVGLGDAYLWLAAFRRDGLAGL